MTIFEYFRNIRKIILHPLKYEIKKIKPKIVLPPPPPVEEIVKIKSFDWFDNFTETGSENNNVLPVSVIVPLIEKRKRFFYDFVYPMIKTNNPYEIIIIDNEDVGVQEKRNMGAAKATQEFIFFCDDDIVLPSGYLALLHETLVDNPQYGYAYTDYQAIVMYPDIHPKKANYYNKSREFDEELLKINNYISTMSLIRKNIFPGFDTSINRLQDWDVWLGLLNKGIIGKYVNNTGFIAYYLDDGITSSRLCLKSARDALGRKHNIQNLLMEEEIDDEN